MVNFYILYGFENSFVQRSLWLAHILPEYKPLLKILDLINALQILQI